ncbi:MAG: hypothetical protein BWY96_03059 [Spirochaetes bacterium ADurb.BinA120]|nr:MAG: hypothetical protein BWY96_03059 [Spirochaetes bacterium ADurb.BinA120]
MACSRIPKRMLRPTLPRPVASKPLTKDLLLGARSADPPTIFGSAPKSDSSTLPPALRVASLDPASKTGSTARIESASRGAKKPSQRFPVSPFMAPANCDFQARYSASSSLPLSANSSYTRPLTRKAASGSHPSPAFVLFTSSSPSGAPCDSSLPSMPGLPLAMRVLAITSEGREVSRRAASSAASIASQSCPSILCTCQPQAPKRAPTSSVNTSSVEPSMVMSFESYITMSRPNAQCPARDAAS